MRVSKGGIRRKTRADEMTFANTVSVGPSYLVGWEPASDTELFCAPRADVCQRVCVSVCGRRRVWVNVSLIGCMGDGDERGRVGRLREHSVRGHKLVD